MLSNTKKPKKLWSVLGKGNASSPKCFLQIQRNQKEEERKPWNALGKGDASSFPLIVL